LGIPMELLREMLNRLEDSLKEITPLQRMPATSRSAVAVAVR
jgi:hypothetical protein